MVLLGTLGRRADPALDVYSYIDHLKKHSNVSSIDSPAMDTPMSPTVQDSTAIGLDVEQTVVVACMVIAINLTGVIFRFPLCDLFLCLKQLE